MVWIPGGEFSMGSHVESEALCALPGVTRDALPVHRVYVDGFWMDATEVTNDDFARFVTATGYVTIAERTPTAAEFPGAPPDNLVAGSVVFTATTAAVRWTTTVNGGDINEVRAGATRRARQPRFAVEKSIRSSMLATTMPWRMRRGQASGCRPKPSGSLRPAAG